MVNNYVLIVFILSQLLFVAVGRQITTCCKYAVYKIPLIKSMVDASPVDAIFLEPNDVFREDPFVLPDVLGYLGMPDPARWAVPSDLNRLVGIVKLARCLKVEQILHHLGSILEIAPESLCSLKTGMLCKKIRSQLRCVHVCIAQAFLSEVVCTSIVNLVLFTQTVIGSIILDIELLIANWACYVNSSIINLLVQLQLQPCTDMYRTTEMCVMMTIMVQNSQNSSKVCHVNHCSSVDNNWLLK